MSGEMAFVRNFPPLAPAARCLFCSATVIWPVKCPAERVATAFRLVLVTLLGAAIAFCADPLIGTWRLNVANSKFNPGPPPRSQKRAYKITSAGLNVTVVTTDAQGKATTVEFPAIYDGKTYPVNGGGLIDALALVMINNFQSRATLKHAGNVIASAERTISEDGRVLTISYNQPDEDRPIDNVSVYEKE
jgi:hypothetical protein